MHARYFAVLNSCGSSLTCGERSARLDVVRKILLWFAEWSEAVGLIWYGLWFCVGVVGFHIRTNMGFGVEHTPSSAVYPNTCNFCDVACGRLVACEALRHLGTFRQLDVVVQCNSGICRLD